MKKNSISRATQQIIAHFLIKAWQFADGFVNLMKCIMRYRAIVDLTFSDIFGQILHPRIPTFTVRGDVIATLLKMIQIGYQIKALT